MLRPKPGKKFVIPPTKPKGMPRNKIKIVRFEFFDPRCALINRIFA